MCVCLVTFCKRSFVKQLDLLVCVDGICACKPALRGLFGVNYRLSCFPLKDHP